MDENDLQKMAKLNFPFELTGSLNLQRIHDPKMKREKLKWLQYSTVVILLQQEFYELFYL